MENQKFFRNVIITSENENKLDVGIKNIYGWKYKDDIKAAQHLPFCLVNDQLGYIVSFKQINVMVYKSLNIFRYINGEIQLPDIVNVEKICEDILLQLCVDIKKQFKNGELYCSIIPDIKDCI